MIESFDFAKKVGSISILFHISVLYAAELEMQRGQDLNFQSLQFEKDSNTASEVDSFESFLAVDFFMCNQACLKDVRCFSFNLASRPDANGMLLCELLPTSKYNGLQHLMPTEDFDYYSVAIVLNSCSHAKANGFDASGNYVIDPDGREGNTAPFQVYCDMRDNGGVGVTVIGHDSEARTLVQGCEPRGCYSRDVTYVGISNVVTQLGQLTKVSAHCEQDINYECHGSVLDIYKPNSWGWLQSRDGQKLQYWGGAPRGSKKCACAVTSNCTGGGVCNCDFNRVKSLQEDGGTLTYKEDLPITQLRFGDVTTRHGEKGYHTLGKFKCYG